MAVACTFSSSAPTTATRQAYVEGSAQGVFPALVRAISAYDGEADSRRRAVTRDALMFRSEFAGGRWHVPPLPLASQILRCVCETR